MRQRVRFGLLVVVTLVSCSRALAPRNVDQRPKRQACPGEASPSTSPARRVYYVFLEVAVDTAGRVDPATVLYIRDPRQGIPDNVVEAARAIVVRCRYTPAQHQGRLVPLRTGETIRVEEPA